jgi:hypothetical protein
MLDRKILSTNLRAMIRDTVHDNLWAVLHLFFHFFKQSAQKQQHKKILQTFVIYTQSVYEPTKYL